MDKRTYSKNPLFMLLGLVTIVAILVGGFTVISGYGQAQTFTDQFTVEFESIGTPLCGGEEVFFFGEAHFVFHETVGPDGQSTYSLSHLNYQKAIGVTKSGEEYIIKEVNKSVNHFTQTGVNEFSTVINGILVDKGQGINGANTHFKLVLHAVIHPNGEVTGEVDNVEIKCEGGSEDSSVMDLLENIL